MCVFTSRQSRRRTRARTRTSAPEAVMASRSTMDSAAGASCCSSLLSSSCDSTSEKRRNGSREATAAARFCSRLPRSALASIRLQDWRAACWVASCLSTRADNGCDRH